MRFFSQACDSLFISMSHSFTDTTNAILVHSQPHTQIQSSLLQSNPAPTSFSSSLMSFMKHIHSIYLQPLGLSILEQPPPLPHQVCDDEHQHHAIECLNMPWTVLSQLEHDTARPDLQRPKISVSKFRS